MLCLSFLLFSHKIDTSKFNQRDQITLRRKDLKEDQLAKRRKSLKEELASHRRPYKEDIVLRRRSLREFPRYSSNDDTDQDLVLNVNAIADVNSFVAAQIEAANLKTAEANDFTEVHLQSENLKAVEENSASNDGNVKAAWEGESQEIAITICNILT